MKEVSTVAVEPEPQATPVEEPQTIYTPDTQDPAELAMMQFTMYNPRFQALVSTLSNKDLKRLVIGLVEGAELGGVPNFHEENAKQAFVIGIALLNARWMFELNQIYKHHEALDKATSTAQEIVTETKQGEESNG